MAISSNIKNSSWITPQLKLSMKDYWDFYLHPGEDGNPIHGLQGQDFIKDCLISYFPLETADRTIESEYKWSEVVLTSGLTLNDIGLVGLDNGLLLFDKATSDCEDFYQVFTGSTLDLSNEIGYLNLTQVTGYTKDDTLNLKYPIISVEEINGKKYTEFYGGWYQGCFKLHEYDYQLLPLRPEAEFGIEFYVKPMSYETTGYTTVNDIHPENKGIFFYMGIRAENKFFDVTPERTQEKTTNGSTFFSDCDYIPVFTSDGLTVLKHSYFVETDNKFPFFDRTESGLTTCGFDTTGTTIFLKETDITEETIENKFITFDRTESGKKTCSNPNNEVVYVLDTIKDITDNAFALRITDDGKIGYKLITKDCDHTFIIEEGYSPTKTVIIDDWNHIFVRMVFNETLINCSKPRVFKLYFYVDGYLKYISKELPELMFRGLTADKQKQQTVPYNISVGGGTQGLMETVYNGYSNDYFQNKEIEKYFCGSFIGGLSNFRFYNCRVDYTKVLNNYLYYINNFK